MKVILSTLCLTLSLMLSVSSYAGFFSLFSKNYTRTQHPIVLVHGLYGFDSLLGMDYFYRVPAALERSGATVYIVTVAGANETEVRGEQLLEQLETLSAVTGHAKFNLIGHSHGSPTSRYVASIRPDLVASVTGIGGTNKGSRTADLMHIIPEDSFAEDIVALFATTLASLIDGVSGGGYEQDAVASFRDLTTAASHAFNEIHPQGIPTSACGEGDYEVNGIRYYSWSGTKPLTNALDLSDMLLGFTSLTFFGEANDGLVSRCSSHLGQVIRDDYRMNHLDETNLLLGLHDILSTDPLTVFRQHANRLKKAGL
ncbi:triacylglycerol lipase [Sinobacterium caligoides]|uniref:Triacylglycerol lipase n=1 Tax=Sinobacterium caligoides TaxID=933926 RepID=A0A3N2DQB4_9GAMM|nr:triacylglycerol lipase [Sinobacterium caligoides]ROS02016.1 triacylglycerol lipase [Sinobacterium caligoides]